VRQRRHRQSTAARASGSTIDQLQHALSPARRPPLRPAMPGICSGVSSANHATVFAWSSLPR
jgi:hypothetical protein